jgi:hypothetical protein
MSFQLDAVKNSLQTALVLLQTKGGFDVKGAQKYLDELEELRRSRVLEDLEISDEEDDSVGNDEVGIKCSKRNYINYICRLIYYNLP